MKRIQTIAAYLVVLVLAGVSSLKSAEPGRVMGKALVRSVSGKVTFINAHGETGDIKVNMELKPGTTITTGADAFAYLNVNGNLSTVRVAANTTLVLSEMSRVGSDIAFVGDSARGGGIGASQMNHPRTDGDTETMLDLKSGEILGQVKKLTGNSQYEIKTPHGIAGVRGTDLDILVVLMQDGTYQVTFTSVEGQLVVSVTLVPGTEPVVKDLNSHECWTPGYGDVHPTPLDLLNQYLALLANFPPPPPGPLPPPRPYVPPYLPPSNFPTSPNK